MTTQTIDKPETLEQWMERYKQAVPQTDPPPAEHAETFDQWRKRHRMAAIYVKDWGRIYPDGAVHKGWETTGGQYEPPTDPRKVLVLLMKRQQVLVNEAERKFTQTKMEMIHWAREGMMENKGYGAEPDLSGLEEFRGEWAEIKTRYNTLQELYDTHPEEVQRRKRQEKNQQWAERRREDDAIGLQKIEGFRLSMPKKKG
jgi:hypothetical protein